jgi:uncharacterized repeat protein (TIGR03803 family)
MNRISTVVWLALAALVLAVPVRGAPMLTALASFGGGGNAGLFPYAGVISVGGNLYGTTNGGGANNDGTVYELVAGSNTIST